MLLNLSISLRRCSECCCYLHDEGATVGLHWRSRFYRFRRIIISPQCSIPDGSSHGCRLACLWISGGRYSCPAGGYVNDRRQKMCVPRRLCVNIGTVGYRKENVGYERSAHIPRCKQRRFLRVTPFPSFIFPYLRVHSPACECWRTALLRGCNRVFLMKSQNSAIASRTLET